MKDVLLYYSCSAAAAGWYAETLFHSEISILLLLSSVLTYSPPHPQLPYSYYAPLNK